jgi:cyclopropane fatty-acyl-phospholipid synthase-like methyltransferase
VSRFHRNPASFRDPSGFVFHRDGLLLRQVNDAYRSHFDALGESGLYAELVSAGLLVPHEVVDPALAVTPDAYQVIAPQHIPFISYPYEWCFGQLEDAALLTLDVQRRALERGLTLKDASAFNVQFMEGRPVLIDTLSFELRGEGEPWIAYRQFCQHFLAPLLLMAHVDVRLSRLFASFLDGLPLDLTSDLLPRRTWLRPSTLLHVHMHARSLRRYSGVRATEHRLYRSVSQTALLGLVDSLESSIRRLSADPSGTEWADYERDHNYSDAARRTKEEEVQRALEALEPDVVWDLGANTGLFSRLAARAGARVVSMDADHGAVELNYRAMKEAGEPRILPLLVDLASPTPASGWANEERDSLGQRGPADLLLALALIHHLGITHNVPLARILEWLSGLGRHVLVEFVPKSDPQAQRLLLSREDIFRDFTQESFEASAREYFAIEWRRPVADTGRTLYLMRSLNGARSGWSSTGAAEASAPRVDTVSGT